MVKNQDPVKAANVLRAIAWLSFLNYIISTRVKYSNFIERVL